MKMTNPDRATRGGDVPGSTKNDPGRGLGDPLDVANASYDPGYGLDDSLCDATIADLKHGYMSYGVGTGETRGKGYR